MFRADKPRSTRLRMRLTATRQRAWAVLTSPNAPVWLADGCALSIPAPAGAAGAFANARLYVRLEPPAEVGTGVFEMEVVESGTHVRFADRGRWDPPPVIDCRLAASGRRTGVTLTVSRQATAYEWGMQAPGWDAYLKRIARRLRSEIDGDTNAPGRMTDVFPPLTNVAYISEQSIVIMSSPSRVWRLARDLHGGDADADSGASLYWYTHSGEHTYFAGIRQLSGTRWRPSVGLYLEAPGRRAVVRHQFGETQYELVPGPGGVTLSLTFRTVSYVDADQRRQIEQEHQSWLGRVKRLAEAEPAVADTSSSADI